MAWAEQTIHALKQGWQVPGHQPGVPSTDNVKCGINRIPVWISNYPVKWDMKLLFPFTNFNSSYWMHKYFHTTLSNGCYYLSKLGLKLYPGPQGFNEWPYSIQRGLKLITLLHWILKQWTPGVKNSEMATENRHHPAWVALRRKSINLH